MQSFPLPPTVTPKLPVNPKGVQSAPPPVLLGELQIGDIRQGSVLTVTTEGHIYTINFNASGQGILMSTNSLVLPGLVVLYGAWDYPTWSPVWGSISRGRGLLFAHLPNRDDITKTSPAVKISLTYKRL